MKIVQIICGILLFVVVGIVAVNQQVRVVQLGYQLHASDKQRRAMEEDNRKLRAQIATKRNLRHLAEAAEAHGLNIVPPENQKQWATEGPTRPLDETATNARHDETPRRRR